MGASYFLPTSTDLPTAHNISTVSKNSKNNKINFFSRTAGYFWLNFGVKYQWNIGIQNYKNEKNL